jgi:hypothetical protein
MTLAMVNVLPLPVNQSIDRLWLIATRLIGRLKPKGHSQP